MIDIRQSPQYAQYMRLRRWTVETVSSQGSQTLFVFIRNLGILPLSIMKLQRFSALPDFTEIERLASRYGTLSVTLEPGILEGMSMNRLSLVMKEHGYRKGRWPMLPTKTIRISLSKSEASILSEMKKDARRSIKTARRQCDTTVFSVDDKHSTRNFYRFWKTHGRGYVPKEEEFRALLRAFGHHSFVVTAFSEHNRLLSGAVILIADLCSYYYFAATSELGRSRFAGYLVVWEAIRESKRRGCSVFDLEGVYDPRFPQLKRWRGFSAFKKKFGGRELTYPGVFTKSVITSPGMLIPRLGIKAGSF